MKTIIWASTKLISPIICVRKCFYIEKNVTGDLPFIRSKIDATYKVGTLEDLVTLREILKPWNHWLEIFKERIQRSQTCMVCVYNGKTIGYIWMSNVPESDKKLGLTIRPRASESYGFDLYVLSEYRKNLVGFELISQWLQYCKESGKQKAIGVVMDYNKPMLLMMQLAFKFKKTQMFQSLEFLKRRGVVISKKKLYESNY